MGRPAKVLLVSGAALAVAFLSAACGTRISVPKSNKAAYTGAVLFSQRCSGCHTLSYAGTHGSASNIKTRLVSNGPNFNLRCERPAIRILYAIENGGFSGATMPQNIVVGEQARDVARFVATYSGRLGQPSVGQAPCSSLPVGNIPAASTAAAGTTTTATPTTPTTTPTTKKKASKASKKKASKKGASRASQKKASKASKAKKKAGKAKKKAGKAKSARTRAGK